MFLQTFRMRELRRSAIVNQPPGYVFDLVNDLARYPEFVPDCTAATVISRTADEIVARLDIRRGALHTHFTTRNRLSPPDSISMELVDGPFKKLEGLWRFRALGDRGCEITLTLRYLFSNPLKGALLQPLLAETADQLVHAFVRRAQLAAGTGE